MNIQEGARDASNRIKWMDVVHEGRPGQGAVRVNHDAVFPAWMWVLDYASDALCMTPWECVCMQMRPFVRLFLALLRRGRNRYNKYGKRDNYSIPILLLFPASPSTGSSTYFMHLNQVPAGGACLLTHPERNRAMLDVFTVTCSGWFDPEGVGISTYTVTLYSPGGPPRPMVSHLANRGAQVIPLVFPPGTFDVEVAVTDKWGAFATVVVEWGLEIAMPSKEEYENAHVESLIQKLEGSGDVEMLTMTVTANTAVSFKSEWMSLSGTPAEEQTKTLLQLSEQTNTAAKALSQQTSFDTIGPVAVTSNTIAEVMSDSTANLLVAKSIDIEARNTIIEVVQAMVEGIEQQEVIAPKQLQVAGDNIASITSSLMLSIGMVVSDQNCTASGPSDLHKSDDLTFDTDIGTDIYMEIPIELTEIRKCNVRDVSKDLSAAQIPVLDELLTNLSKAILRKSVVGEQHTLDGRNGVLIKTGLTVLNGSAVEIYLGTRGAKISLPEGFCPTGKCNDTVGYAATLWPYPTHTYTESADNLAFGSNIVDMKFMDRELSDLKVKHTEDPIVVVIPRTLDRMGVPLPSGPEFVNSTEASGRSLPIIYSKFSITKNDSSVNIEITPNGSDHRLFLILSSSLMPTLTHHMWFSMVEDIPVKRNDTYDWFLPSSAINGTASYYLGVGEFQQDFDVSLMDDPVRNNVSLGSVQNVSVDYNLQVLTSGCYYFDEDAKEWMGKGLEVVHSDREVTRCEAGHLTSFGAGFFVTPNTVDFDYVFANLGFHDNLTIYITLILTLTIFIILAIWARHKDKLDVRKLGAAPLPDNRVEDKYLYEVLVFTGNKKEAQTDSNVYFVLSGSEDETAVRGLCDGQRNIFRKNGIDVFVMAVPRPLGPLLYLRIWHDNSGKGTNASWYLRYIVFRDVQTGDKYEFIANQWLAVEWDDGEIDRLLPVATGEQRTQFRHLFDTTSNKNLADSHLWFSIFLRPHRSRFTRCQRVGSCFALLFLSMLVNAMWYDRVPEQPRPGLKLGFFSLSPEEIGVGVMGNLIVFPPSFLIVFMFRKARPRHLRKSRIELALKRHSEKEESSSNDSAKTGDLPKPPDQPDAATSTNIIHKKQKKKKMTLPWWFSLLAWALVLACIVISCFFLLMYGIMFGNSKTTKWITALAVSFFSSVLFMEPVKIFLLAILMSVVFKSPDLDEDDVEEDEEEPILVQDEAWLHTNTERRRRPCIPTMIDERALQTLRKTRQREVKMYSIFKEIVIYTLFMWIVLILSHGNRDPNAFFLQRTLREAFLNEGARDNTDFTKVTNSDRLWTYLQNGFLHRLRADVLYNGKAPYRLRGFLGDQNNRIMGYGTIRQIRVRDKTCRLPNYITRLGVRCNGYSSLGWEDTNHYCLGWASPSSATVNTTLCQHSYFRHTTAAQLDSFPVWGARDWYGGGGYIVRLRGKTEDLLRVFHFLQENHWIDEMTRAIIIEFSSYNANVNLFGLSRIMAEFTPGGGITPTFSFEGISLLQHHKNFGSFILACEVAFIAFVLFYMVREVKALCRAPASYCRDYWSYAEVAIILACCAAIVIYLLRYMATSAVLSEFDKTFGNGYINLQYAALLNEIYLYLVSFILFVGILKFIKLLRFNKRIGILSMTLRQCWEDLKGFLIAFTLCFFSFVAMFYLMLNKHLQGFYNFVTAVESCFSMMLGKFNFEKMREVSLVVPVMFFIFVLFNSWVIINLLLTIIIRTFMEVRHSARNQPNEYEMVRFVWGRFKSVLVSSGRSSNVPLSANTPASTVCSNTRDVEHSESDVQIQEFPRKVDKFLEHINSVYFKGSLDYSSKTSLQSSMYGNKTSS
ncbi:LOW QUALITY PROTEIN: polycystin-1-like protein 2 [Panulirus ornatus]|uniref:LOW QUALITY PROTEIN: polycystin-1-like protein 2 n=1 Tax=Panulirus ornatus TaxID=150431 RepID=UPI003A837F81